MTAACFVSEYQPEWNATDDSLLTANPFQELKPCMQSKHIAYIFNTFPGKIATFKARRFSAKRT